MKDYLKAVAFALLVIALVALADLGAAPVHAAGHGQTVLGYFLGATHLLNLPGFMASEWAGARPDHQWTWRAFWIAAAINFPFWLISGILLTRLKRKYITADHAESFTRASHGNILKTQPIADPGQSRLHNCGAGVSPAFVEKAGGTPAPQSNTIALIADRPFEFATTPSPEAEQETAPVPPRQRYISRRHLLLHTTRAAAATTLAVTGYGLFAEARWFEISRRQIAIKGLSPGLDGLRIVQLSDIHHSAWMSINWVRQIVQAANDLAPDLVALTGDYVYRGLDYVAPVARELARLRPRIATLGVMGNHDWYDGGGPLTKRLFALEGLPLIDNTRMCITPNRRLVRSADEGLAIVGVGDLWDDKCLYDQAFDDLPGKMPRILLSHNPDVAEEPDFLKSGHRVDLMLSGHTHGGQISIPGLGAPVTNSAHGQKYAKGLVQSPTCPVFISKGLGMTVMPIRLGVRPEIAVIELRSA